MKHIYNWNHLSKLRWHGLMKSFLLKYEDCLTHWGRVTHICVSKLTIIGSDNGLSSGRRQAIIWTNAGILLIGPLGTNFSEISIEIHTSPFKKMHLKMSSAKRRPFCLGLNVLILHSQCHGCWFAGNTRNQGISSHGMKLVPSDYLDINLAPEWLMEVWSTQSIGILNLHYCKIFNISGTKSPNLNVSHLVLQLSLPNLMKPDVKSRMKM